MWDENKQRWAIWRSNQTDTEPETECTVSVIKIPKQHNIHNAYSWLGPWCPGKSESGEYYIWWKFIREGNYWRKSGRVRIWMQFVPPSHYQQSSVGVRWALVSQLDDKSCVLTEGSVNVMRMWLNYCGNEFLNKLLGFLLLHLFLAISSMYAHMPLASPHTCAEHMPSERMRAPGACISRAVGQS